MKPCETCKNDYHNSFEITADGVTHTYDSFECAIHALAPTCNGCGCRVLGHGVEDAGEIFCSTHCARNTWHENLRNIEFSTQLQY